MKGDQGSRYLVELDFISPTTQRFTNIKQVFTIYVSSLREAKRQTVCDSNLCGIVPKQIFTFKGRVLPLKRRFFIFRPINLFFCIQTYFGSTFEKCKIFFWPPRPPFFARKWPKNGFSVIFHNLKNAKFVCNYWRNTFTKNRVMQQPITCLCI